MSEKETRYEALQHRYILKDNIVFDTKENKEMSFQELIKYLNLAYWNSLCHCPKCDLRRGAKYVIDVENDRVYEDYEDYLKGGKKFSTMFEGDEEEE